MADIDFDADFDDTALVALRRYVEQVTAALGLSGQSFFVEAEPPASAYLAVDGRLPDFPDDDVALLWSETSGWSIAVEAGDGVRMRVAHHLRGVTRPTPRAVARWVLELVRLDEHQVRTTPLVTDPADEQRAAMPRSA